MKSRRFVMLCALLVVCTTLYAYKSFDTYEPAPYLIDPVEPVVRITVGPRLPVRTREAVIARYGRPDLELGGILVYASAYAALEADVTCSFAEGTLREIAFAFPTLELTAAQLRRHADRVLKRLRVELGTPFAGLHEDGRYETHLWRAHGGQLTHTVIYEQDRLEHTIRITPITGTAPHPGDASGPDVRDTPAAKQPKPRSMTN